MWVVSQQAWAFHPAQTESVAPCLPGVGVLVCGCCLMLVCTGHPPSPNQKCCPMPTGCRFVGVLVCWCVGVLVCWCVGVLVCWCVVVLVCWCLGVLWCWCVGVWLLCDARMHGASTQPKLKVLPMPTGCWCVGVLVCCCVGGWVCWCVGVLWCRCVGVWLCVMLVCAGCPPSLS